jgi:cytidyltransferase-like protein
MIFDPKHKVLSYEEAEQKSLELKKRGEKIIMISGVFDIFHMAHVMFLTKTKNLGGIVFVSLGSDETVRTIKGPSRPILTEDLRAGTLAGLEAVDYVVIAKEKVQNNLFKRVKTIYNSPCLRAGNILSSSLMQVNSNMGTVKSKRRVNIFTKDLIRCLHRISRKRKLHFSSGQYP